MTPRAAASVVVVLAASLLLPIASAAGAPAEVTADPPYRATGQWVLNATFAAILLGIVLTWWVVRRYEP